jgi:nucleotide-binding universal stress UspA family protein/hemerythrin-like domain-containing protein
MYKHLLVPIDGTPLSFLTVEQAVGFAREISARLSFMHARSDFGSTGEGSLLMSMSPSDFKHGASGNSNVWLARAASAAAAQKVPCQTLSVIGDAPHEAILNTAIEQGCDLIYMSSHGRRGLRRRITGTVTERLLEIATVPVLVVRVETNSELTAEQRALTVIRNEHRSLGAVIRGMLDTVARSETIDDAGLKWLNEALYYIDQFPERLHHPKEELTLFRLLLARTEEAQALITDLQQQHRNGASDLAVLRKALEGLTDGSDEGAAGFREAVRAYAAATWRHMESEEHVVMPLAARHLTEADWEEIAAAFECNDDPRLHLDDEGSFAELMKRLMDIESEKRA